MSFITLRTHELVVAQLEARLSEQKERAAEIRERLAQVEAERDRYRDLWIEAKGAVWQPAVSIDPLATAQPSAEPTGVDKRLWERDDHEWYADWCKEEMANGARPENLEERWMMFAGTKTPVEAMTAV